MKYSTQNIAALIFVLSVMVYLVIDGIAVTKSYIKRRKEIKAALKAKDVWTINW